MLGIYLRFCLDRSMVIKRVKKENHSNTEDVGSKKPCWKITLIKVNNKLKGNGNRGY